MRRGLEPRDDFYAALDGDRVHEVCADDARCGGEVLWVRAGGGGDLGDGDGGGVGREDCVRGADLRQLGEDGKFEGENLGHGFDDEVNVGETFEFRCPCEPRLCSRGFGFAEAASRDASLELLLCFFGLSDWGAYQRGLA